LQIDVEHFAQLVVIDDDVPIFISLLMIPTMMGWDVAWVTYVWVAFLVLAELVLAELAL
jgi:hypothetical protein